MSEGTMVYFGVVFVCFWGIAMLWPGNLLKDWRPWVVLLLIHVLMVAARAHEQHTAVREPITIDIFITDHEGTPDD